MYERRTRSQFYIKYGRLMLPCVLIMSRGRRVTWAIFRFNNLTRVIVNGRYGSTEENIGAFRARIGRKPSTTTVATAVPFLVMGHACRVTRRPWRNDGPKRPRRNDTHLVRTEETISVNANSIIGRICRLFAAREALPRFAFRINEDQKAETLKNAGFNLWIGKLSRERERVRATSFYDTDAFLRRSI